MLEEVVEATELVGSFGLRLGTEGRDLVVPSSALAALLVVSATDELVPFTPGCGGLRRGGVISPAGANFRGANTCRGDESTRSAVAAVPSTALSSFSSRSKLPAGSCSSQAFCKKKLARASASSAGELGSSIRVLDASARRRRLPCLCRSKQTTNTPHCNIAGQWRQPGPGHAQRQRPELFDPNPSKGDLRRVRHSPEIRQSTSSGFSAVQLYSLYSLYYPDTA